MKKKGFTLIELLAVIVILAIIALISIPLVLKYIQTSKDNARLRSAENYLDAVEKAVVNQNMNGKKFNPYVCNVKDEKLYCDGTLLDVSIKGVKPDNSSVITFNNGKIDRVKLLYEDKIIIDNEKDILVYGEDEEILPAGVYDDDNSLLATWDELVNNYGLDIEKNYNYNSYKVSGSMYAVLNNNPNLSLTTKVIVKDGIKSIGNFNFYEYPNLKNIILPDTVANIGFAAFLGCTNLESLAIPKNVTKIGMLAFQNCSKLKSINIPEGVTSLEMQTFSGCSSLEKVVLPSTLIKLNTSVFSSCSNLEIVSIPNNVTTIGDNVFSKTNLKTINIPQSVTKIGTGVCSNCKNLETITVSKNNTVYSDYDNSNIIVEKATNKLVMGTKNVNIPDGITSIGHSAFLGLGIENVIIPNTVTSIGTLAFGTNNIKILTIPNSITSIGTSAFQFNDLTSVVIPKSVTSMGGNIFKGCQKLEQITVESGNTVYDSRDNSNAIIETSTNKLIVGCKNSIIPNSVTSIGEWSFTSVKNLESITIPESVSSIGYQAFSSSGLTNIIIPDSVINIDEYAFGNCENLQTVTIGKNVSNIYYNAFTSSDNLKTIYYKGTATGAPWGAPNATVISDY